LRARYCTHSRVLKRGEYLTDSQQAGGEQNHDHDYLGFVAQSVERWAVCELHGERGTTVQRDAHWESNLLRWHDGLKAVWLSGGSAKFTTPTLASGTHNITATYNGNVSFSGSSASLTQTVN
jgi:hypothetical protein